MKGLGVCEWSLPLKDEALFAWMKENGVDNVSIGFDYAAAKTEESYKAWCDKYMALSEKYQIPFSILAVNDLCTCYPYAKFWRRGDSFRGGTGACAGKGAWRYLLYVI